MKKYKNESVIHSERIDFLELQYELARQIISIAVSKALNDIQTNTKRSILNLLDLGLLFSHSETQKWFFHTAKQVITTPANPYNSLISRMVSDVDHETIKTFGINIGYSSLTYGANKLKSKQKTLGLKLPWFLIFDMSSDAGFGDAISEIPRWINQGQELGIYCFGFSFINEKNLPILCEIMKQSRECAFVIEITPSLITSQNAAYFKEVHNAVIVVKDANMELYGSKYADAFHLLRKHRCLYGYSLYCSDTTFDQVISHQNITAAITQGNAFCIFRADSELSPANKEHLYQFVCHERSSHGQPLVCFDWALDTAFISEKIFSEARCLILSSAEKSKRNFLDKKSFIGVSLLELIRIYQLTPIY